MFFYVDFFVHTYSFLLQKSRLGSSTKVCALYLNHIYFVSSTRNLLLKIKDGSVFHSYKNFFDSNSIRMEEEKEVDRIILFA